jgi:hypothetical protein
MITRSSFARNDHGLIVRRQATGTIEKCSFAANQIDLELTDDISVQVHNNQFQAGSIGIVAAGRPRGRIFQNRFSGYKTDERFVRMHGADELIFED